MSEVPAISGTVATTTRKMLRDLAGDAAYERALARLTWLPVDLANDVVRLVAEESGMLEAKLFEDSTRRTQEALLGTVYRILMRLTTDEALISRTPQFYSRSFNVGKLSSTFPAPGEALVALTEWPTISDQQMRGLGYGIETTLRVAGRKDARAACKRARPRDAAPEATARPGEYRAAARTGRGLCLPQRQSIARDGSGDPCVGRRRARGHHPAK